VARIPDIERRLLNWARWKAGEGGGGLGYSGGSMWNTEAGRSGYREAIIPTVDVEASATDTAVLALPSELRSAVEALYLRRGTIEQAADRLCCGVATIYRRVDQAHAQLASWFSAKASAARDEAARLDALNESARP
jgi:hypothetical protein